MGKYVPRWGLSLILLFANALGGNTTFAAERNSLAAALESITTDELRQYVGVLADDTFEGREAGSRGGLAAGHFLVHQFQRIGLRPAGDDGNYTQTFGSGYHNILGLIDRSGPELGSEIIVVCAHYDHVGYGTARNSYGPLGYIHNGADDNASGVAAVLEIAEACTKLPVAPRRTILFALWDGEEKGLLGSRYWVNHPTQPLSHVAIAVNFDMIGRFGSQGLQVFGTRTSRGLRQAVCRENERSHLVLRFPWSSDDNSDHYSFFERGIPFLMFHTGLHDDYHRPSDDVDKINVSGIRDTTQLAMNVVLQLSQRPKVGGFREASRREGRFDRLRLESPLEPLPPRLGVQWQAAADGQAGLVLSRVIEDSAADKGGLRVNDRVIRFAGADVTNDTAFVAAVLQAINPVSVTVERPGNDEPLEFQLHLDGTPVRLGISWREDDAEPDAVLLTRVVPGSLAHQAGLRVRDRLYEINGKRFANGEEFLELATSLPLPLELLAERQGRVMRVSLGSTDNGDRDDDNPAEQ